jgi:hypothetical protein
MRSKRILAAVLFSWLLAMIAVVSSVSAGTKPKVKLGTSLTCPGGALHCAVLTWTASTSGSPTSYNVYRTLTNNGCSTISPLPTGCTKVGSATAPAVTYTDSPLAATTTYFWVVTGVNASGESGPSPQATGTTGADPVPSAPTGVTVTAQ